MILTGDLNICQITREAIYNYFQAYDAEDAIEITEAQNQESDFNHLVLLEHTASISISGVKQGFIIVSCSGDFVSEFIKLVLGPRLEIKREYLVDMVGEIGNTISGYFQKFYGDKFVISAPNFLEGDELDLIKKKLSVSTEIIEFDWVGFVSKVIISLE